ncbi:MAG: acetyl-CoA carboxylase biotin carboxyl carrier protein [Bacteriovoracaceae bacterium]|nr:acetyl-CoA carboxylase biotin carboxyl carrier protein [Bacteriovoracaceae bacterium]
MELDKIKKFLELARKENVAELDYQSNDIKIRVSFKQRSTEIHLPSNNPISVSDSQRKDQKFSKVDSGPAPAEDLNLILVKAPFVGTYYSSAGPGEPPYIKVGDKVKTGQTLCILEAMKIMNEIECEQSGQIVEICVENENYVEYGQILFKIKP